MTKVKSKFSDEQLTLMQGIGINLLDTKDYSDDELMDIQDKITEEYQDVGFDSEGEPTNQAKLWEEIIDIFFDEFNI